MLLPYADRYACSWAWYVRRNSPLVLSRPSTTATVLLAVEAASRGRNLADDSGPRSRDEAARLSARAAQPHRSARCAHRHRARGQHDARAAEDRRAHRRARVDVVADAVLGRRLRRSERAVVGPRRSDAPLQLALSEPGPAARNQAGLAQWAAALAVVPRPGRLQGDQRHARASVRQPCPRRSGGGDPAERP